MVRMVLEYETSATVEPRLLNPQDGADQRRGDIKVSKHGNTSILDVDVVCPGTQRSTVAGRRRVSQGSRPGGRAHVRVGGEPAARARRQSGGGP